MKERILCCAILRNNEEDNPVLGRRHWDAMWLKRRLYWENTLPHQQGFLTTRYRWVNREEAFKIAKEVWQLKVINQIDWEPIDYTDETLLYSEYIW